MTSPELILKRVPQWWRKIITVSDDRSGKALAEELSNGWKFDPFIAEKRLEDKIIFSIVLLGEGAKIQDLNPEIEVLAEEKAVINEFADAADFISTIADDSPNGKTAGLIKEGWVQCGFAPAKNMVQLKKPREIKKE